jgi:DNA-binding XRE family transcriptional regulator
MADEIGILDTSYSKIEREGTNNLQTLLKITEIL